MINVKLIIAIIVVVGIIVFAWYFFWVVMPLGSQQSQKAEDEASQPKKSSIDSTAEISGDFTRIPDDSAAEDSVKLIDNSVSSF